MTILARMIGTAALLAGLACATPVLAADPPGASTPPLGYDPPGRDPLGYDPALAPALGYAAPAPASGVVALSPQDREAAIEAGAAHADDPIGGAGHRGVHGEVGFAIGSNGMHALYGTTVVPLGDSGTAAFSFMNAGQNLHYRR